MGRSGFVDETWKIIQKAFGLKEFNREGAMIEKVELDRVISLLERQLVIQLYAGGASQDDIARVLQKSKAWVNTLLKGLP